MLIYGYLGLNGQTEFFIIVFHDLTIIKNQQKYKLYNTERFVENGKRH